MFETFTRKLKRLNTERLLERARWGLVHAEARAWEAYFDVNTRRHRGKSLRPGADDGKPYEPLPWMVLRRAMNVLSPGPEDVLLDYGSGLGRVLLLASHRRLKRVIGVEVEPQLATRARANLATAQRRLFSPVELVVADAASWPVPDDVTAVFLFNPFVGKVMQAVQAHLEASLLRRPRPLKVVYCYPRDQPDLFADCTWLRARRRIDAGVYTAINVVLYEHASWGSTRRTAEQAVELAAT